MSNIKVLFAFEKETTRTLRFKEQLDGPMDTPVIGTLYVPKVTLKALEYKEGKQLVVTIEVSK